MLSSASSLFALVPSRTIWSTVASCSNIKNSGSDSSLNNLKFPNSSSNIKSLSLSTGNDCLNLSDEFVSSPTNTPVCIALVTTESSVSIFEFAFELFASVPFKTILVTPSESFSI